MYKFLLCQRYLQSRMIAIVSIISVMLGVATMIVVNSVMEGFRTKMRDRLRGILADVIVESGSVDGMERPEEIKRKIMEAVGDRVVAMTAVAETFGILEYKINGQGEWLTRFARIVGIEPEERAQVSDFAKYLHNPKNQAKPSFDLHEDAQEFRQENADLVQGDRTAEHGRVMVGWQLATYRGPESDGQDVRMIHPGQEIILTTGNALRATKRSISANRFVVTDLFKCEMSEYDSQYVFVPLKELQSLRGMGNRINSIQIRLTDFAHAEEVVKKLRTVLPNPWFQVETWEQRQGAMLQAVQVEKAMLSIILSFIIANAGFGILSVFYMIVSEKTRDIGIMKALGASDSGVMSVFVGYGLALGLVGCGLGAAIGIGFTVWINPIERLLSQWFGVEIFPRDVYYFKEIPVELSLPAVFWVCLGAVGIAVLSSLLPARQAARLRTVEALRYE